MRGTLLFKLVVGGLLSFLGVSCSTIGVGMLVAPTAPDQSEAGVAVLLMGLFIGLLPGAILLAIGLRARRDARLLAQVIAMGQAAARLPLQQVGEQLGVPIPRARELVLEAIGAGKLAGRMDYEHGVFISGSAHTGVRQTSATCPACGAVSDVIVAPGTAANCHFCGQQLA